MRWNCHGRLGGRRQLRLSKPPSTAYSHTSASHWAAVSPLPWTNLSASGVFSLGEVANFRERHAAVCTEERPQFSLENMQLIYIEDAVLSAMKAGQELPAAPELTGTRPHLCLGPGRGPLPVPATLAVSSPVHHIVKSGSHQPPPLQKKAERSHCQIDRTGVSPGRFWKGGGRAHGQRGQAHKQGSGSLQSLRQEDCGRTPLWLLLQFWGGPGPAWARERGGWTKQLWIQLPARESRQARPPTYPTRRTGRPRPWELSGKPVKTTFN